MKFLNNIINKTSELIHDAVESIEHLKCSKDVKDERMAICESCEHLIKTTKQCRKCGCFMEIKTHLASVSCPIGKWEAVKFVE